jgi:hypothetical protein
MKKLLSIPGFFMYLMFILGFTLPETFSQVQAATPQQDTPLPEATPVAVETKDCKECHLDIANLWSSSPHAHAFEDPIFQEKWASMGQPEECLHCHASNHPEALDQYTYEGVNCEDCHGPDIPNHPPADIPTHTDMKYCGSCHPTTLGEVHLSGHSMENQVRCVDCHDPHRQNVLIENPDDMCKSCHEEDLKGMDEALRGIHLQENIGCIDYHMLDARHTFLIRYRPEQMNTFLRGYDCSSQISIKLSAHAGPVDAALQFVEERMNWPVVHRVSRAADSNQCERCHVINDALREDFEALGYHPSQVEEIAWNVEELPAITENDLDLLVSRPKQSWGWVYWIFGVAAVFSVFEVTVSQKLRDG